MDQVFRGIVFGQVEGRRLRLSDEKRGKRHKSESECGVLAGGLGEDRAGTVAPVTR